MHGLVVVGRVEVECASDFPLLEALDSSGSLQLDIVWINFPESITLGLHANHEEVDGNVGLLAQCNILLHETDDDLSLLGHRKAVLWVIEPLLISVEMRLRVL